MKKKEEKQFINNKALILSIAIVAIISISAFFLFFKDNKEKKNEEQKEVTVNVPKGCVACKSESGICCPIAEESSLESEELSELEVKLGCVKCPNSISGKCCPVKKEDVEKLKDWCLTCTLTGDICCPVTAEELGLTQEELEKGCWVCEEDGTVCCPDE